MKTFEDLGRKVAQAWSSAGNDLAQFPQIATAALTAFDYNLALTELSDGVAKWMVQTDPLPEQINVHNTFGQPPVTVFHNGNFVVDLYFWTGFDTSVHSHGFRGAFKVLHGRSLEEIFTLTPKTQISPDVMITEPQLPALTLLEPGEVRTIGPGQELSHRVIHLDSPTITLCVKTINEPQLFQWHYFTNGLAIQKRHVSPSLVKKIYYFQYLLGIDSQHAFNFVDQLIATLDRSTQVNLCEDLSGGTLDLGDEALHEVLDRIYRQHAEAEWFQLYEQATQQQLGHLDFSSSNDALVRLTAHLVNTDRLNESEATTLLDRVAGHSLTRDEMKELLRAVKALATLA